VPSPIDDAEEQACNLGVYEAVTDRDIVAEEFMNQCLKKIFTDVKLTQNELDILRELVKFYHGRYFFAKTLISCKVT
jgi:hypothetical protein